MYQKKHFASVIAKSFFDKSCDDTMTAVSEVAGSFMNFFMFRVEKKMFGTWFKILNLVAK